MDGNKITEVTVLRDRIYDKLSWKDFKKNCNFKNDNVPESEVQRVYHDTMYPRDSKIYSENVFVNFDNGEKIAYHWTTQSKLKKQIDLLRYFRRNSR